MTAYGGRDVPAMHGSDRRLPDVGRSGTPAYCFVGLESCVAFQFGGSLQRHVSAVPLASQKWASAPRDSRNDLSLTGIIGSAKRESDRRRPSYEEDVDKLISYRAFAWNKARRDMVFTFDMGHLAGARWLSGSCCS